MRPLRKEKSMVSPDCPQCGDTMVLRTAKRGRNIGNKFWGCSDFPDCFGTSAFKHNCLKVEKEVRALKEEVRVLKAELRHYSKQYGETRKEYNANKATHPAFKEVKKATDRKPYVRRKAEDDLDFVLRVIREKLKDTPFRAVDLTRILDHMGRGIASSACQTLMRNGVLTGEKGTPNGRYIYRLKEEV